jgi:chorismate synthase
MGGPVPPIGAPSATLPGLVAGLIQLSTEPVDTAQGRHDPGVLPRAVPMVEAKLALVRADHLLRQQGQCSLWSVGNRTRRPGR